MSSIESTKTTNSSTATEDAISSVYTDTASFGRLWTLISAIIATVVGLGVIGAGIYFLIKHVTYTNTTAIVKDVDGSVTGKCNGACTVTLTFTYQGKDYTKDVSVNNTSYYVGQKIQIYIEDNSTDTDGLPNVTTLKPAPQWIFGVMIGIGALIIIFSWVVWYAAKKVKIVAAAAGAGGLYDMFIRR